MNKTTETYTVTYNGQTFEMSTTREVAYAVAMVNYHGEVAVVLSKNERTAANQLKRDLSTGYAVRGEIIAL